MLNYRRRAPGAPDGKQMTILELIEAAASEHPGAAALRMPGESPVSWAELAGRVKRSAAAFSAAGLREGETAAIAMPNSSALPETILAAAAAGASAVPIDPSHPAFIVRGALLEAGLSFRFRFTAGSRPGWAASAGITCAETACAPAPAAAPAGVQPAGLTFFTPGCSGRPKAAVLGQSALLAAGKGLAAALGLKPGDNYLSLSHFSSAWTLQEFLACAFSGASFCAAGWAPPPEELAAAILELKPAVLRLGGGAMAEIFGGCAPGTADPDEARAAAAGEALSALGRAGTKVLVSAGAPGAGPAAKLESRGCAVLRSYGLTEACGFVAIAPAGGEGAGAPIPGVSVRTGEDGEIVISGASLMSGYAGTPCGARARLSGGELFTGDFGRAAADGTVVFSGRGGAPGEEGAAQAARLLEADALVRRAAVAGADPRGTPYPMAFVILDGEKAAAIPGLTGASGTVLPSPARAGLAARLASALACVPEGSRPREFAFFTRWPKVTRVELTPDRRLRARIFNARYVADMQAAYARSLRKAPPRPGREPVFLSVELGHPRPSISAEGSAPRVHVKQEKILATGVPSLLGALEAAGFDPDYVLHRFQLRSNYAEQSARLAQDLASRPGRVVAAGCFGITLPFLLKTMREVKRLAPDKIIVLGGPGPSGAARAIIEHQPFVDAVIAGEAERTLPETLERLLAGRPLDGLKGVAFRRGGGQAEFAPAERLTDLDSLPPPSYSRIDTKDYLAFAVSTMRGCPSGCKYCGNRYMFGPHVEPRSLERVIAEMRRLYEEKKQSHFFVIDEIFTLFKDKALEFCARVEAEFGGRISWFCYSSVDRLDEETMEAMAASGCIAVCVGVESGAERVLRANKRTQESYTPRQALERVGLAASYFSTVTVFLVVGFPEETLGDFFATLRLSRRFTRAGCGTVRMFWLKAIPLTPVFEENRHRLTPASDGYHWPLPYVRWVSDLARLDPALAPWAMVVPTPHIRLKSLLFASFALRQDGRGPLSALAARALGWGLNRLLDVSNLIAR